MNTCKKCGKKISMKYQYCYNHYYLKRRLELEEKKIDHSGTEKQLARIAIALEELAAQGRPKTVIKIQSPRISITRGDLLEVYCLYPRKIGKSAGLAKARAQIKTMKDYEDLLTATKKYKALCEKEGV